MSIRKQKRKQKNQQFIAELKPLIPTYRRTWMAYALGCQAIEQHEASAAIKTAYTVLGKPEPEVYFCESPAAALDILLSQLWRLEKDYCISYTLEQQFGQLKNNMEHLLWQHLRFGDNNEVQQIKILLGCGEKEVQRKKLILNGLYGYGANADWVVEECMEDLVLWNELFWSELLTIHLEKHFWQTLNDSGFNAFNKNVTNKNLDEQFFVLRYNNNISQKLWGVYGFPIKPEIWSYNGCWLDLCNSVFDDIDLGDEWKAFQAIIKHCGWIYPLERFCIVCDRPRVLSLDDNGILHSFDSKGVLDAQAKPAIQFVDGFSLSAYHGTTQDGTCFYLQDINGK